MRDDDFLSAREILELLKRKPEPQRRKEFTLEDYCKKVDVEISMAGFYRPGPQDSKTAWKPYASSNMRGMHTFVHKEWETKQELFNTFGREGTTVRTTGYIRTKYYQFARITVYDDGSVEVEGRKLRRDEWMDKWGTIKRLLESTYTKVSEEKSGYGYPYF